jgi:hypothetical protein
MECLLICAIEPNFALDSMPLESFSFVPSYSYKLLAFVPIIWATNLTQ